MSCFEEILAAIPNKAVAAWPLASHLTNHASEMNKTYWVLL